MKLTLEKTSSSRLRERKFSYLSDHSSEDEVTYGDPSINFDGDINAKKAAIKNYLNQTNYQNRKPETPEHYYRSGPELPTYIIIPGFDKKNFQSIRKKPQQLVLEDESLNKEYLNSIKSRDECLPLFIIINILYCIRCSC